MPFESSPVLSEMEQMPDSNLSFENLQELMSGDELLEELCDDTVKGASRYFEKVITHERFVQVQSKRLEPSDYQARLMPHDLARRLAHNALVDKFRILARAANKAGRKADWYEKIAGPYEDRNAIGQWAMRTVFEQLYVKGENEDE